MCYRFEVYVVIFHKDIEETLKILCFHCFIGYWLSIINFIKGGQLGQLVVEEWATSLYGRF